MTGRAQKIPAVRADAVPTSAREEGASGTPGGAAGTRRTKIGGLAYSVRIAVVGNPNSGKTTIFNMLTGSRQHVGNYSGVTVEKKEGVLLHEGREVIFLDLPGAYSLSAYSPEERIAGAVLRAGTEQAVLYVADAGLLERSLVLAVHIREMGMPMVLACNMMDELRAHGKDIDFAALSGALNVTALPTVGVRGQGMEELLDAVERAGREDPPPPLHVSYGPVLDPLLDELVVLLEQRFPTALHRYGAVPPRWMALMLLEKDDSAWNALRLDGAEAEEAATAICREAETAVRARGMEVEELVAGQRFRYCRETACRCLTGGGADDARMRFSDRIDSVLAHSFWGAGIMLGVLYAMFFLVISLGAYPQEWLEAAFRWLGENFRGTFPEGFATSLVTDGVIAGLGGVFSFVPLIIILFGLIAILEDSGYMARMAYLADKPFHFFGLHGTSVMSYIIAGGIAGGCAIPGVMATRAMRSPMEKMATMLTLPYMVCGAKLPVVVLLAGTFFPRNAANILFAVVLTSWLLAFFISLLLRKTILRGEAAPLVMEMPPYRWPNLRTILLRAWERSWMYLKRAALVLAPLSVLLWAAMTFPSLPAEMVLEFESRRSVLEGQGKAPGISEERRMALQEEVDAIIGEQEAEALRRSLAGRLGTWLEQYTQPVGFDWRTNVALLGGIAAKEVIVSTLGTAYSLGPELEENAPLSEKLRQDPSWNEGVALSLLVFVLLYAPCFVTLVVMRQESGSWKWVAFSIVFNTALAYGAAFFVYRLYGWWTGGV